MPKKHLYPVGLYRNETSLQTFKNKGKPWQQISLKWERRSFFLHKLYETGPLFGSFSSGGIFWWNFCGREPQKMNYLAEVREIFHHSVTGFAPRSSYLCSSLQWCCSLGKQIDWLAGSGCLWLPAQPPGHSKAPTFHLARDLWPWPCGQHGRGRSGRGVGIRLPGHRPQMKEPVVSIPHTDLWGPGSCKTGISPNCSYSHDCVDKLYLQLYMCLCVTREVAVWLPVPAQPQIALGLQWAPLPLRSLGFLICETGQLVPNKCRAGGCWGSRFQSFSIILIPTTQSQQK